MIFEWDEAKAVSNVRKHGVTFQAAIAVFDDPLSAIHDDTGHSDDEIREIVIGWSGAGKLVVVVFVQKNEEVIRVVSARHADAKERRDYEENLAT